MLKEWFQAAAKFGAPSVLIAFLLWWLTGDFNVRLRAIESQHTEMNQHASRTEDSMGRTYMSTEKVLYVLQTMCVNDAKTNDARERCLREK